MVQVRVRFFGVALIKHYVSRQESVGQSRNIDCTLYNLYVN